MDELRIVLLGKQGAGKSASGNTLLRNPLFLTRASSEPVTEACSMGMFTVDKQTIKVIDTPGWCDSSRFETDIKQEIIKFINMSSPGPHVFLLVLPIGRFTNEEINTVMNILKEFGDEVTKYMIVLFTKGDDLEDMTIEDYLKEVHPNLKKIIQICGKRYHVFNNRDKKNSHQVSSLLKKINEMVERNERTFYTIDMYQKMKDQQMDNRRGQQFKREEDNSVHDNNKNLSDCENGGMNNRCDAEGKYSERKSISQDTKEQCERKMAEQQNSTQNRNHEGLKSGEIDLEGNNEDKLFTAILKDKDFCKMNVIDEHNKSQSRENRELKQSTEEDGKRDLDKNEIEIIELQKTLKQKEIEVEQIRNRLEQLKASELEQLKQKVKRLMQENQEGKTEKYGPQECCADGGNGDQAKNNR